MKILIYGAGVIGCYLTHVLCAAGNDVTLLARGIWRETLERDGLTIVHHLQKKDHPSVSAVRRQLAVFCVCRFDPANIQKGLTNDWSGWKP